MKSTIPTSLVIRNALLVHLSPPRIERGDLRLRDGLIVESGPMIETVSGEMEFNASSLVVMPGFVVGHHHLYSALASSMPAPPRTPTNFHEILQLVWWRLDRALDHESIFLSGAVGAAEAAKCGVTTIIDHHASPNCIPLCLDALAGGIRSVGQRGVICYEVTERNSGAVERLAGLDENGRFAKSNNGPWFAGMVGAHAAFTISDEGLRECAELAKQHRCGVHIHVAEDPCDDRICKSEFGAPLWERLKSAGLIAAGNIFGHGTHLTAEQIKEATDAGVVFAHNCRSNMNNGVGYAKIGEMMKNGRVLLGTDGIGSDMMEEFRAAVFKASDGHAGIGWDDALGMLANNAAMAGEKLGVRLGSLDPGAQADLVFMDIPAGMPSTGAGALAGHLLFSLASRHVRHTMVAGKWILRDRELTNVEEDLLREKVANTTTNLWKRLPEE